MSEPTAPPPPSDPLRIGAYTIVRRAGAGGMGVVYLAHDAALDRPVAVKVLRSPDADERFVREARSAARLNHPNVVAVHAAGHDDGLTFIAMEWVDGGSLADHLRHHLFLDWPEATVAVRDAAAGLAAAHAAGVVHRDVKPANLMRRASDGTVKVADFGLARLHAAASELTGAGAVLGTPAYLSPEQCRGGRATAASDVYALGCTYYHLLTGRPPFAADSLAGLLFLHQDEPFPDARKLAEDVPPAVLNVIARATRKRPADRYADAAAMGVDLTAALAGEAVAAVVPTADVPNNLPQSTTSFVGRTRDRATVADLLSAHRLVTLLGPGGTGKTRLSLAVAADQLARHPGGVWFVDLAGVAAGGPVVPSMAAVLGIGAPGGDLAAALVDHLRPRRALLVLDNCEHVVDAAAAITAAVLAACPAVRVLATGRQPLGVSGEAEVRVDPLTPPEAVRLFADRAALVRPDFAVDDDNAADVASVCRRLDGNALAVELAAVRLRSLSLRQIADRLDDALSLLSTGPRTALPRQRTLRALIDWSFDLLDDRERETLARLSVFAGSCSLDAAEAVVAGGPIAAADVVDLVAALVEKSLVVCEDRGGGRGVGVRYRLLATIRAYAADKLGDRAEVARRHLAHFAEAAAARAAELDGPSPAAALAALDADHDNVRAALDGGGGSADAERLAVAAVPYWLVRGNVAEGLARVEGVLAAGGRTSALHRAASCLTVPMGRWAEARDHAGRALAAAGNDAAAGVAAMGQLGIVARQSGDWPAARRWSEAVLAARRAGGDASRVATALNNLANLLLHLRGEAGAARAMLVEARDLYVRLGNATWVAYADLNLGGVDFHVGDAAAARARFTAARAGLMTAGDEWGVAYAEQGLGECDLADGDAAAARGRFGAALAACRRFGDRPVEAKQLDNLARAAEGDGLGLAVAGHRLRRELGDAAGAAESLETIAAIIGGADGATLIGAAAAARERLGVTPDVPRAAATAAAVDRIRGQIGPAAYDAAFAAGAAMTAGELPVPLEKLAVAP